MNEIYSNQIEAYDTRTLIRTYGSIPEQMKNNKMDAQDNEIKECN